LQQSKAAALETESFAQFQQTFREIWTNVQIGFFNFIAAMVDGFNNFINRTKINIAIARAEFNSLPTVLKIVKENFFDAFKNIGQAAIELTKTLGNALTLDFDAAEKSWERFKTTIKSAGKDFQDAGRESNAFLQQERKNAEDSAKARIAAERKVAFEQAKLEKEAKSVNNTIKQPTSSTTKTAKTEKADGSIFDFNFFDPKLAQAALDNRLKLLEEAAKRELAILEENYLEGNLTLKQYEIEKLRITSANLGTRIELLDTYGQKEGDKRRELNIEMLKVDKQIVEERAKIITDQEIEQLSQLEEFFLNKIHYE
jgi:hypothetical protein